MPKALNIETGATEDLPLEYLAHAFATGKYRLAEGTRIPLNDQEGNPATVDASQAFEAIQSGYSLPDPNAVRESVLQKKYGGAIEGAKAFAESAASSATLGLSDVIAQKTGLVTPEARVGREQANPIISGAGTVTGILAPALLTAGLAPAGSAVATAARAAPATMATRLGVAAKSIVPVAPKAAGAARKVLQSLGREAVGSAVEGAAFGVGNVVKEAALGDPDLTAESAIAEIGLSAALSGGIGAALHLPGAFKALKKLPTTAEDLASDAARIRVGETARDGTLGTVEAAIRESGESPDSWIKALTKRKKNAGENIAAAERLGAPVLEPHILDSPHAQKAWSVTSQNPTIAGVAAANKMRTGMVKVEEALDSALTATTQYTKEEAGAAIQSGILKRLEKAYEPIKAGYEQLKTEFKTVPLIKESLEKAADDIMGIEGVAISKSSPEFQLARNVADELSGLTSVDDLKAYQSAISRRVAGKPELKFVAGEIRRVLGDLEENQILEFARTAARSPDEKLAYEALIGARGSLNKEYKRLIQRLSTLGDVVGKKRIYGPKDFFDFIEGVTPEKLAKKLFAKGNSRFTRWFANEFPEEFSIISDLEKNRIRELAVKDGKIVPGKVISEFDRLERSSPGLAKQVFGEGGIQRIKDSKTYIEGLGPNINPSGTSVGQAYQRFFTNPLSAVTQNAGDSAVMYGLRQLAGATGDSKAIATFIGLERAQQKIVKQINASAKIIASAKERLPAAVGAVGGANEDGYEQAKISKEVEAMAADPSILMQKMQSLTEGMADDAPNTSQSAQAAALRAIQFLGMKIPRGTKQRPLGAPYSPGRSEVFKFNRYYRAINKPMTILQDMERGTLSPESLEAVTTVYPKLYSQMQRSIFEAVTSSKGSVPYQSRLMLSMFMGQSMDDSVDGDSIAANQASINAAAEEEDQTINPTLGGVSKLDQSERALTPMQATANRSA